MWLSNSQSVSEYLTSLLHTIYSAFRRSRMLKVSMRPKCVGCDEIFISWKQMTCLSRLENDSLFCHGRVSLVYPISLSASFCAGAVNLHSFLLQAIL